jgi:hypothetical protein
MIEISGVLFAVLKYEAQQKRNRPPPEKIPGLNSDAASAGHS